MKKKTSSQTIKDDKLKSLSPTLRQKKRFILLEIKFEKKLEFKEISEFLLEKLVVFLGSIECSKGGVWFLRDKFDFDKQQLVLKVSTKLHLKVIGVLALITSYNIKEFKVSVKRVSGTLKGLQKEN